MQYTVKNLDKSQVELTITVSPADYKHALEHAAESISMRAAIKGFRPGKAPYAVVKEQMGEIKIMEEALEHIVQENFFEAVQKEKLETIGMPKISIEKMAPGNDLVFKAAAALLPKVNLPDLSSIKAERKEQKVEEKQLNDVLENLQKMQRVENPKDGAAAKEDKMVIDLEMFIDKVPMDGGQAKDHQVYLSEDHYIKGLNEQLIGLKKGDTKEFMLPFPEDHYQKQFAGKNVDFKITVKDVFSLSYPELGNDFAKKLGQENMEKLKEILQKNLLEESDKKEDQRVEIEILEKIIEGSVFGELPEILINSEKTKMFHELKHNLEQQGANIDEYLKNLKKTEEQIFADFTEQAVKRAKAALASRQLAIDNGVKVEKNEIDEEIKKILAAYGNDKQVEENLKKHEVLDTIATMIQNRKVVSFLKEKVLNASK